MDELLAQLNELLAQVDGAASLDDDALTELTNSLKDTTVELLDGGELTDDVLTTAQDAKEKVIALKNIAAARAEEAAAREAQAAELLAALQSSDGDDDAEDSDGAEADDAEGDKADDAADTEDDDKADEGAEATETEVVEVEVTEEAPAADDERVPVAASASVTTTTTAAPARVTRMAARAPELRQPRVRASAQPEHVLRASMNAPAFAGENIATPDRVSEVFSQAFEQGLDYRGPEQKIILASIGSMVNHERTWGEARTLDGNERSNETKINAVTSAAAIRASGGICAPSPVDYTQPIIGTDQRPVRDALARFAADRGGVRFIPPPKLADMSGGYTQWTAANDLNPSSPTTKNVLTMTCPADVLTQVYAIVTALKVPNFRQLYWTEQVDAWVKLSATYAARKAEQLLLTSIGTGSTNVTAQTGLGTARDVLATLDRAASGLRNRNRTGRDFPLRLIAPAWLLDNMRTDLARQAPGDSGSTIERLAMADTELSNFFTSRNFNVTWALDGESGQDFGAQTDGALDGWPSHVIMYLYPEGSWVHLDGGQLNLGVIRDSTLVGTNDFIIFSEFMENVAFHGTESMRIDIDICPSGKTVSPTTSFDPCAGGS